MEIQYIRYTHVNSHTHFHEHETHSSHSVTSWPGSSQIELCSSSCAGYIGTVQEYADLGQLESNSSSRAGDTHVGSHSLSQIRGAYLKGQ